jgi:hypothetical protein
MKRYLMILSVIVLSLVLIAGCGKDKKTTVASNPASATQATNANGQTTLTLGSVTVTATVQDSAHAGLANIHVSGYLTHNSVLLEAFDSTQTYYPSITLTPLATSKEGQPGSIQSPENIMVAATMILYPVQLGVSGIDEASGLDDAVADEWTAETWQTGTLQDAYNVIDTVSAYDHGVFVSLSQTVFQSAGAPFRVAVFLPNQYSDFATFSSLAGYVFHIFAGDTLHFAQIRYSSALLPILQVDNIIMDRNFWAQFTLVWGETPYDLDSHLWTPKYGIDSSRYHVYYGRSGNQTEAPYADLDVDDTYSFGPEHITIYQAYPGSYTYAVHDYRSDDGLISNSQASVSILKPDGTVQTLNVPTTVPGVQENWWWIVARVDGTTGAVTVVDSLSAYPPYPNDLKYEPAKKK